MIQLFSFILLMTTMGEFTIFDFDKKSNVSTWRIVDDVVMGGRSAGEFSLSKAGYGVFEGRVSLENNGGFSSVRHRFDTKNIEKYSKVVLRLKGDGKRYQFRIKSNSRDYYSYITYINTTKDWETFEIPLSDFYPTFRGRTLNMDNFPGEKMEEIAFLIANKKAESFRLEIDTIELNI